MTDHSIAASLFHSETDDKRDSTAAPPSADGGVIARRTGQRQPVNAHLFDENGVPLRGARREIAILMQSQKSFQYASMAALADGNKLSSSADSIHGSASAAPATVGGHRRYRSAHEIEVEMDRERTYLLSLASRAHEEGRAERHAAGAARGADGPRAVHSRRVAFSADEVRPVLPDMFGRVVGASASSESGRERDHTGAFKTAAESACAAGKCPVGLGLLQDSESLLQANGSRATEEGRGRVTWALHPNVRTQLRHRRSAEVLSNPCEASESSGGEHAIAEVVARSSGVEVCTENVGSLWRRSDDAELIHALEHAANQVVLRDTRQAQLWQHALQLPWDDRDLFDPVFGIPCESASFCIGKNVVPAYWGEGFSFSSEEYAALERDGVLSPRAERFAFDEMSTRKLLNLYNRFGNFLVVVDRWRYASPLGRCPASPSGGPVLGTVPTLEDCCAQYCAVTEGLIAQRIARLEQLSPSGVAATVSRGDGNGSQPLGHTARPSGVTVAPGVPVARGATTEVTEADVWRKIVLQHPVLVAKKQRELKVAGEVGLQAEALREALHKHTRGAAGGFGAAPRTSFPRTLLQAGGWYRGEVEVPRRELIARYLSEEKYADVLLERAVGVLTSLEKQYHSLRQRVDQFFSCETQPAVTRFQGSRRGRHPRGSNAQLCGPRPDPLAGPASLADDSYWGMLQEVARIERVCERWRLCTQSGWFLPLEVAAGGASGGLGGVSGSNRTNDAVDVDRGVAGAALAIAAKVLAQLPSEVAPLWKALLLQMQQRHATGMEVQERAHAAVPSTAFAHDAQKRKRSSPASKGQVTDPVPPPASSDGPSMMSDEAVGRWLSMLLSPSLVRHVLDFDPAPVRLDGDTELHSSSPTVQDASSASLGAVGGNSAIPVSMATRQSAEDEWADHFNAWPLLSTVDPEDLRALQRELLALLQRNSIGGASSARGRGMSSALPTAAPLASPATRSCANVAVANSAEFALLSFPSPAPLLLRKTEEEMEKHLLEDHRALCDDNPLVYDNVCQCRVLYMQNHLLRRFLARVQNTESQLKKLRTDAGQVA